MKNREKNQYFTWFGIFYRNFNHFVMPFDWVHHKHCKDHVAIYCSNHCNHATKTVFIQQKMDQQWINHRANTDQSLCTTHHKHSFFNKILIERGECNRDAKTKSRNC